MKRFYKKFLPLFLLALSLFTFGCNPPVQSKPQTGQEQNKPTPAPTPAPTPEPTPEPTPAPEFAKELNGVWSATIGGYTEKYAIQATGTTSFKSGDNGYEGKDLAVVFDSGSKTAGYIYFKYTKSMMPDYSYSTTAPDVGKYYAVRFKDLTKTTIKLSGAYKNNGKTSTATLDEAKKEFTEDNGYFAIFSSLNKAK